jgi:hypothetical protein
VIDLDIRQIKLISGEEIICLVSSDNETTYLVERPLVVQSLLGSPGKYQLLPWFSLSNSNLISIDKTHIISHAEVDDNIKGHYVTLSLEEGEDDENDDYPDYLTGPDKIVH